MKLKLPPNRNFGLFFSFVFFLVSIYFFIQDTFKVSYIFFGLSVLIMVIAFFKADLLLPFNKLWMRFGELLGLVISPIILGALFFFIFTPIGLLMSVFGRDELRLKKKKTLSFWKDRNPTGPNADSFYNQF